MIIKIQESELFTKSPDERFSSEYSLPRGFWDDLWRRHILLEYTVTDLCDFYEMKTKRPILRITMRRWINRAKIFSKAHPIVAKGATAVNSEYFGDMEWILIKELTKNVSVSKNPKAWA